MSSNDEENTIPFDANAVRKPMTPIEQVISYYYCAHYLLFTLGPVLAVYVGENGMSCFIILWVSIYSNISSDFPFLSWKSLLFITIYEKCDARV